MRFISLLAIAAPLAAAIQIDGPAANSTLTKGSTVSIPFSTVDTDPTTFGVYLVNFVNWPPFYTLLDTDVETSSQEVEVTIPCSVDSTYGYQFNFVNGTNSYVIYAQSSKFSIGGEDCVDPTPSASTCPPAATVTVTVSGNSTRTPTAPTATVTSQGNCPKTIGWNSGYEHPVTLTSVPHAGQPAITAPPSANGQPPYPYNDVAVVYQTVYASLETAPQGDICAC